MFPTVSERDVIDINASVRKHEDVVPNVLAAHALSGCDIVAAYTGIGKGKPFRELQKGKQLSYLGMHRLSPDTVVQQATKFLLSCFGCSNKKHLLRQDEKCGHNVLEIKLGLHQSYKFYHQWMKLQGKIF